MLLAYNQFNKKKPWDSLSDFSISGAKIIFLLHVLFYYLEMKIKNNLTDVCQQYLNKTGGGRGKFGCNTLSQNNENTSQRSSLPKSFCDFSVKSLVSRCIMWKAVLKYQYREQNLLWSVWLLA